MDSPHDASDWVIHRTRHDKRHITVVLTADESLSARIAELRRIYPTLKKRHPSDLLKDAKRTSTVDLGLFEGREAYALMQFLELEGFDVNIADASFTTHLPINRANGTALIVEDDEQAEAFCLQLIHDEASIEDIEA